MIKRKRIAIETPIAIHKRIVKYCKERGLSMTQYVIQLIIKDLEEK